MLSQDLSQGWLCRSVGMLEAVTVRLSLEPKSGAAPLAVTNL